MLDRKILLPNLFNSLKRREDYRNDFEMIEEYVKLKGGQELIETWSTKFDNSYSHSAMVWDAMNENKETFLTCGVRKGNLEFVKQLLTKTKFINGKDGNKQTALDIAVTENQDEKMTAYLLSKGATVFNRHELYKSLVKMDESKRLAMMNLFKEYNIDLTKLDEIGHNLIDYAIKEPNLNFIIYLHTNEIMSCNLVKYIDVVNAGLWKDKDWDNLILTQKDIHPLITEFSQDNQKNLFFEMFKLHNKKGKLDFVFKSFYPERNSLYIYDSQSEAHNELILGKFKELIVYLAKRHSDCVSIRDANEMTCEDVIQKFITSNDSIIKAMHLLSSHGKQYSVENLINVMPDKMIYNSTFSKWIDLVIQQKCSPHTIDPSTGNTILMYALKSGHGDAYKLIESSEMKGQDDRSMFDHENMDNQTVLDVAIRSLYSIYNNLFAEMETILEHGATKFNPLLLTKYYLHSEDAKACLEMFHKYHILTFEVCKNILKIAVQTKSYYLVDKMLNLNIQFDDSQIKTFENLAKEYALSERNIELSKCMTESGVKFTSEEMNTLNPSSQSFNLLTWLFSGSESESSASNEMKLIKKP